MREHDAATDGSPPTTNDTTSRTPDRSTGSAPGSTADSTRTSPSSSSRRSYLQTAGALGLASITGLSGCLSGSGGATGTLRTSVKDAPGDIADFESCVITIDGIWLKPASEDAEETTEQATDADGVATQEGDDVDQGDDREYHAFDEAATADLVELQDGNSAIVDDRAIETGEYAFLQLDVSAVDATLSGGGETTVDTPGDAPLQFQQAFEIRADERTTFTADFTPVKLGQTERYVLQPVATGTDVTYESEN